MILTSPFGVTDPSFSCCCTHSRWADPHAVYLPSCLSDPCAHHRDWLMWQGWDGEQQRRREPQGAAWKHSSGTKCKGIPGESRSCRGSWMCLNHSPCHIYSSSACRSGRVQLQLGAYWIAAGLTRFMGKLKIDQMREKQCVPLEKNKSWLQPISQLGEVYLWMIVNIAEHVLFCKQSGCQGQLLRVWNGSETFWLSSPESFFQV